MPSYSRFHQMPQQILVESPSTESLVFRTPQQSRARHRPRAIIPRLHENSFDPRQFRHPEAVSISCIRKALNNGNLCVQYCARCSLQLPATIRVVTRRRRHGSHLERESPSTIAAESIQKQREEGKKEEDYMGKVKTTNRMAGGVYSCFYRDLSIIKK